MRIFKDFVSKGQDVVVASARSANDSKENEKPNEKVLSGGELPTETPAWRFSKKRCNAPGRPKASKGQRRFNRKVSEKILKKNVKKCPPRKVTSDSTASTASVCSSNGIGTEENGESEKWIAKLNLSVEHKRIIENGEWLTDDIMNAAMSLIPEDDQGASAAALNISIAPIRPSYHSGYDFFCDNSHWVLTHRNAASLTVYNSLDCPLSTKLKQQIKGRHNCDQITLAPCSTQQNMDDCGVYAIANMVELIHGNRPGDRVFKMEEMRPFLVCCLERQALSCFPSEPKRGRKGKHSVLQL